MCSSNAAIALLICARVRLITQVPGRVPGSDMGMTHAQRAAAGDTRFCTTSFLQNGNASCGCAYWQTLCHASVSSWGLRLRALPWTQEHAGLHGDIVRKVNVCKAELTRSDGQTKHKLSSFAATNAH